MAKQHIHQKEFRLPFLDWTNRTNIHTSHKAKENIRSKNSMLVFLDWKHKINRQTRHMAKQHVHQKDSRLPFFRMDAQNKQTHKSYGQRKYSSKGF